jgi:mono/diheme cytochrome c family protein
MCHGREGRGSPLFDVVLRDTVTVADEDSLVDFILNSSATRKPEMPAYNKTLFQAP